MSSEPLSTPLHTYMKRLLQEKIIQEQIAASETATPSLMPSSPVVNASAEIVCDNARSPTRHLRMRQRALNRIRKIHRSYPELQTSSTFVPSQQERRRKLRQKQQGETSYSFQSPTTVQKLWCPTVAEDDELEPPQPQDHGSPCSVALLKVMSPKSARWSPKSLSSSSASYHSHKDQLYLSPKSARWSPTPLCLVRHESEKDLVCPIRWVAPTAGCLPPHALPLMIDEDDD